MDASIDLKEYLALKGRIAELEREREELIAMAQASKPEDMAAACALARADERERYREVLADYRETLEEMGYSDLKCDCDPSVGIMSCCWCRLRALEDE